jgi:uncharacterized RDD family membrane protein YckC
MSASTRQPEPAFGALGTRGMAFVFDLVLVTTLAMLVAQAQMALEVRLPLWFYYVLPLLYFSLLPATPLGATPGKRMVGLRLYAATPL